MAKYQYVDNTYITPTRMTAYWGTNATTGHNHNGLDADGSAPQIDASTGLTGLFEEFTIDVEWLETSTSLQWKIRRSPVLKVAHLIIQGAIDTYGGIDTITVDRPGGTPWGADWFPYATADRVPYIVWYDNDRFSGGLKLPSTTSESIKFYQYSIGESASFQGTCGFVYGMVSFPYDP